MSEKNRLFGIKGLGLLSNENLNEGLILIIGDGSQLVELMIECLKDSGYEVLVAQDSDQAARLYQGVRPDLLICNFGISERLVKALQREYSDFKALLLVDGATAAKNSFNDKASKSGVVCVIAKPFNVMELLAMTHLIMVDKDVFHTNIQANNSAVSQTRRRLPAVVSQLMLKQ
jgi:DNA-binding response OmpR family regulator